MNVEEFKEYITPLLGVIKYYNQIAVFNDKLVGLKDDSFLVYVQIAPTGLSTAFTHDVYDAGKRHELNEYYPLYLKMISLCNTYDNILEYSPIIFDDKLENIEQLTNCVNMKKTEGERLLYLNRDIIGVMSGNYLSINKADSCECIIRDFAAENSYIWEYDVFKKKLNTHFRFITRQLKL